MRISLNEQINEKTNSKVSKQLTHLSPLYVTSISKVKWPENMWGLWGSNQLGEIKGGPTS